MTYGVADRLFAMLVNADAKDKEMSDARMIRIEVSPVRCSSFTSGRLKITPPEMRSHDQS